MTLYLKYRPQRVSDLDLPEVKEALAKYLTAKSLPHAWLFTGPRGTGKTSSARILAKSVNCTGHKGKEAGNFEPCNECGMCEEITAGTAIDVVEIDAASNRGIDEIRELKERINLAPMKAKSKVYIIDEVHMLTTEAANALLKTLEEPPANTYFVLCTTEADKLLETVVSRCTRVNFRKPKVEETVSSLKRVVEGEKGKATAAGLEMVAKAARGSFRDATKILEQVILSHKEVTEEAVREAVAMSVGADPVKLIELVETGETKKALELVTELDVKGVNLRRFVEALVEQLRERLLEMKEDKGTILKLIFGLDKAYEQMKSAVVSQLPLEIWVIENSNQKPTTASVKQATSASLPTANKTEAPPAPTAKVEKEEVKPVNDNPSGKGMYALSDLEVKWGDIMKLVRPKNHSVEALLRSTRPIEFDGERLILEVFYKFHKDKLETDKCRQIVEMAVAEAFSVDTIKLNLKLGQGQKKGKEEVTAANVGDDIVKAAEAIFGVGVV